MANESAKIDVNNKKTLLAVTDNAAAEIRRLLVDPTTGRLKVSAVIAGGTGDVVGPAVAVDSNFAAFDTTTGKLIKDSGYNSSSFLTSLSGAVLVSQSTPQTIGDTTNRLLKLWATDITCTNAITGSVTGNAGTVTNGVYTTGNQSIAGIKTFSDTTDASNTTTGGTIISGGLAVAKRVYALDMTVTNSISGSITGNAGTVTNGIYTTSQVTALAATVSGDKDKYLHSNSSTGVLEWSSISTVAKATSAEINTGTDDTKFATASAIAGSFIGVQGGWSPLGACTYEGADAPTYTFSIASDVTTILGVGMRIKLTDSTVKYFIITDVGAYSGGKTIITVYGGTGYTLSGGAITYPYYSTQKAPFGFPTSPIKWTVKVTDTTQRTKTSPTQDAWYYSDLGSLNISVPIGAWKLKMCVLGEVVKSSNDVSIIVALSTANNSASDMELQAVGYGYSIYLVNLYKEKTVLIAAKTTYYLIAQTGTASVTNIQFRNDLGTLLIEAVCAYL